MKSLRQVHLYLGTFCAPLILYFCLSGAWQLYRLNDIPKGETPTALRAALHALSNPHTHSALPGADPRTSHSTAFDIAASASALAMVATALLGLVLAWKTSKKKGRIGLVIAAGALVPLVLLFF